MAGQVNPVITFIGAGGVYGPPNNPGVYADPRFASPDQSDTQVPVAYLDMRHPEFEARHEAWRDMALLYDGGTMLKARAERLLKKRPREDEEVYAGRLDRFSYQNILATGLGWYGAAMFDTPPEIFFDGGSGPEFYNRFLENCDCIGTSYVDFWKRVFQFLLTYGSAWILTDVKSLDPNDPPPLSLQDEKDRGIFDPHILAYTPLNVINWRTNELGELQWAVVKTEFEEQEFLGKRWLVSTWYYYDKTDYKVYEYRCAPEEKAKIANNDVGRTAKLIREGKHALAKKNRLPIRRVSLTDGLWLANRAYLLLVDHLNQDNTLAWSLFMSNLAIPVIIGDFDASNMTSTESGYLQFPAGTTYQWTEPAGTSFTHSAKRVESLREECFRSMNLQAQGRSMRATPAMQSGRSKQLEMAPAKQILAGMGDDLRRHMQAVLIDVKDVRGDEVNPDVRGFTFEDDMTTEEVFAVTSVLSLKIPSDSFEKYIFKKVAKAWMVDANRDELVKVYDQIDRGPTIQEREEEELKTRVKLVQDGMRAGLKKAPGGPQLPPGRGGDGPSPIPKNP